MKKENSKNYTALVERYDVQKEDINNFVRNGIVKFIFFDKKYSDISSDLTINEIHKFKSRYPGYTYISMPIKVVKNEDEKYAMGIEVDSSDEPNAFMTVSKHDLREFSKETRKMKKAERIDFANRLCLEYLEKLNYLLKNEVYLVTIKCGKETVLTEKVTGTLKEIDDYINKKINNLLVLK